jgi:predicted NAD/FAD-dependent oxidoreductase
MRIGIVGAGLSGLMAAHYLSALGHELVIVDKGRSVGGRLATRRVANGLADHGAQFFTVRSPTFQQHVDRWVEQNLAYIWTRGWSEPEDGHPRYAVRGGMNQLAKALAAPLESMIHLNWEIARIAADGSGWQMSKADGATLDVEGLLLTAPVPQSMTLLKAGNVELHEEDVAALSRIKYAPCLCLLVHLDGPSSLPAHGARQTPDALVTWSADNKVKGISPKEHVLTLHIKPEYSRTHYNDTDQDILTMLEPDVKSLAGPGREILDIQVKRWRYSLPTVIHPEPFLRAVDVAAPLVFAGDAFGGSRVEGAALSGLAAGTALG